MAMERTRKFAVLTRTAVRAARRGRGNDLTAGSHDVVFSLNEALMRGERDGRFEYLQPIATSNGKSHSRFPNHS